MRAIVRGRTVIIIAHRLAAVRPCSRIVGMRQGESSKSAHAKSCSDAKGASTPICWRCNPNKRGH